jgi:hypothetical protein
MLLRLTKPHAFSNNEQWRVDVSALDAAPALAAAAGAAQATAPAGPTAFTSQQQTTQQQQQQQHPQEQHPQEQQQHHVPMLFQSSSTAASISGSLSNERPTDIMQAAQGGVQAQPQRRNLFAQQQQQQKQPGRQLLRPTAVQPAHLRELLQQQITSATCCSELHELLLGRQQVLTLKHLSCMVQQVGASACTWLCVLLWSVLSGASVWRICLSTLQPMLQRYMHLLVGECHVGRGGVLATCWDVCVLSNQEHQWIQFLFSGLLFGGSYTIRYPLHNLSL